MKTITPLLLILVLAPALPAAAQRGAGQAGSFSQLRSWAPAGPVLDGIPVPEAVPANDGGFDKSAGGSSRLCCTSSGQRGRVRKDGLRTLGMDSSDLERRSVRQPAQGRRVLSKDKQALLRPGPHYGRGRARHDRGRDKAAPRHDNAFPQQRHKRAGRQDRLHAFHGLWSVFIQFRRERSIKAGPDGSRRNNVPRRSGARGEGVSNSY